MLNSPLKYDYLSYNRYNVLRPNWLFWLIVVFLARHSFLFFLIGYSHGRGGTPNPALAALIDPWFFISDVPSILVFGTLGARLPSSGRAVRFLWRSGRVLLLSSCVLYLGLLVWRQGVAFGSWHPVNWVMVAVTLLAAAVLLRSGYLKDLFEGFPEPDVNEKEKI